jgi:hypothetical protein
MPPGVQISDAVSIFVPMMEVVAIKRRGIERKTLNDTHFAFRTRDVLPT